MPNYTQLELNNLAAFQLSEKLCVLAYEYDKKSNAFKFSVRINEVEKKFDVKKIITHSSLAPNAIKRVRGMVLIPEKGTPFQGDENVPIWFSWTGTDTIQSALATFSEINSGEYSYRVLEKQFLEQSLKAIEQTKKRFPTKKIELHFTGHSLGGALAQLHFSTLQRAIAQLIALESLDFLLKNNFKKQDEAYLENLKKQGSLVGIKSQELAHVVQTEGIDSNLRSKDIALFTLHPWNSVGIIQATANYTQKLIQDNADKEIFSKAQHTIFLGDPIQQIGTSNIFSNPLNQDTSILEVTTPAHIAPTFSPYPSVLGIVLVAIGRLIDSIKKHRGKLSHPDGTLNINQYYRILSSRANPREIIAHLLTNKSRWTEFAKIIQPILFSKIHTVSAETLIEKLNKFLMQSNLPAAKKALEIFISTRTQAKPIKRLNSIEQNDILNTLLIQSRLLETMDRLFLQAGDGKDIDTMFDKAILKKFLLENASELGRYKLFDRILTNRSVMTLKEKFFSVKKKEEVLKEFKTRKVLSTYLSPLRRLIESVTKRKGKLNHVDGTLNIDQHYRALSSRAHSREIIAHLLTNKFPRIKLAEVIKPILFYPIHNCSVTKSCKAKKIWSTSKKYI